MNLKKTAALFARPLDLLVSWRCKHNHHRFKRYRRTTDHKRHCDRRNYYMRECVHCGYTEIQNAGPMGNGKWRDVKKAFRHKWEQEEFSKSIRQAS